MMNPYTGHLVQTSLPGYDEVPKHLQEAAKKELAGRPETTINLRGTGPLQAWARKKRKAQIAAKSRRTNRRK